MPPYSCSADIGTIPTPPVARCEPEDEKLWLGEGVAGGRRGLQTMDWDVSAAYLLCAVPLLTGWLASLLAERLPSLLC